MNCITSVSFVVNINGRSIGRIILKRGFCQGDPISAYLFAYLFLLCAKGLSVMLNEATKMRYLSSLSMVENGPVISYLFLADDSLIFTMAEAVDYCSLKMILVSYEKA